MKKVVQKRRGGSGVKAAKADPLAPEVILLESEDEEPHHHQVGHSGNFCLRRLNSLIQQAEQLVPEPLEESRLIQEMVGPVVLLVKVEEAEPILERVEPILEPAAVEESPSSLVPQSVLASPGPAASPEIPSVAEEPLETQVGLSEHFCWQHPDVSFQVKPFLEVSLSSLPLKKRRRSSQASSSPSPSSRSAVSF